MNRKAIRTTDPTRRVNHRATTLTLVMTKSISMDLITFSGTLRARRPSGQGSENATDGRAGREGLEHLESDDTHIRIRSLWRHCDGDLIWRLLKLQRLAAGEETRGDYFPRQAGEHE